MDLVIQEPPLLEPGLDDGLPADEGLSEATQNLSVDQYCLAGEELKFLTLINDYRARNGVPQLKASQTLGAAAEHHSEDMYVTKTFSHTLSDGTTWLENIVNHGYTYGYRSENIAWGYGSAQAVFDAWRASSGHNTTMLNAGFAAIGIGQVGTYYWTTTFGGTADGAAQLCGADPVPASTIVTSASTAKSTGSMYAHDGDLSTAWVTTGRRAPSAAAVWFDTGGRAPIATLRWSFSQTGFADAFDIQLSDDGVTWSTISRQSNAPAGAWQSLAVSASARYVRFAFSNPNADPKLGYLAEVQVLR